MADFGILKEPYEISWWEDVLDKTDNTRFKEIKKGIIGSNTMTAQYRAREPVFTKNINGSFKLVFTMYTRYVDEETNQKVENPFSKALVNETKIKLRYGVDENGDPVWYDFLIKNVQESSDKKTYVYTCESLPIMELSKNGFNLEFRNDLRNNSLDIDTFVTKVLDGTDWKLEPGPILQEWREGPVYELEAPIDISVYWVYDLKGKTQENYIGNGSYGPGTVGTITMGSTFYIYYPSLMAKNKFVSVLWTSDEYTKDESTRVINNAHVGYIETTDEMWLDFSAEKSFSESRVTEITGETENGTTVSSNYGGITISRAEDFVKKGTKYYLKNSSSHYGKIYFGFIYGGKTNIISPSLSTDYRGKFLLRRQKTAYDKVLGRYVNVFKDTSSAGNNKEIYGYDKTEFIEPILAKNLTTLGSDLIFSDGKVDFAGWKTYDNTVTPVVITDPPIVTNAAFGTGINHNVHQLVESWTEDYNELNLDDANLDELNTALVDSESKLQELLNKYASENSVDLTTNEIQEILAALETIQGNEVSISITENIQDESITTRQLYNALKKFVNAFLSIIGYDGTDLAEDYVKITSSDVTYNSNTVIAFGYYPQNSQATSEEAIRLNNGLSVASDNWRTAPHEGLSRSEYIDSRYMGTKYRGIKATGSSDVTWYKYEPALWKYSINGTTHKLTTKDAVEISLQELSGIDLKIFQNNKSAFSAAERKRIDSFGIVQADNNDAATSYVGTINGDNNASAEKIKFEISLKAALSTERDFREITKGENLTLTTQVTLKVLDLKNKIRDKLSESHYDKDASNFDLYTTVQSLNLNPAELVDYTILSFEANKLYALNTGIKDNYLSIEDGFIKDETYIFAIEYCDLNSPTLLEKNFNFGMMTESQADKISSRLAISSNKNKRPIPLNFIVGEYDVSNNGVILEDKPIYFKTTNSTPFSSFTYTDTNGNEVTKLYCEVKCEQSKSYEELKKIAYNIGIFIKYSGSTSNDNKYNYAIKNFQFFKKEVDKNNRIIFPEIFDVTTEAYIKDTKLFYDPNQLVPCWTNNANGEVSETTKEMSKIDGEKVEKTEIKYLDDNGYFVPVYDDMYQKVRTIEAAESNRFNILQSLCEKFECWMEFRIEHEANGEIKTEEVYDDSNPSVLIGRRPKKSVIIIASLDDEIKYPGFKYGINLSSINRTLDSSGSTSKIIVKNGSNALAKNGFCTIARAPSNPTGENFFYDFSYYINQGFLSYDEVMEDLYEDYYAKYKLLSTEANQISDELSLLLPILSRVESSVTVYEESINAYKDQMAKVSQKVSGVTGFDIDYYMSEIARGAGDQTIKDMLRKLQLAQVETYSLIATYPILLKKLAESEALKRNAEDVLKKRTAEYNDYIARSKKIREEKDELNAKFFTKYSRFIQEGTWTSNEYIDDELYYIDSQNVLAQSVSPKVTYTFNVIDVKNQQTFEGLEMYQYKVGDHTYIEDTEFFGWMEDGITPYREEVIVTEIANSLDSPESNKITIKNYKTQFEDLFQRITANTQSLQFAKGEYNRAASSITPSGTLSPGILQSTLLNDNIIIANPQNESIFWDEEGIQIIDSANKNNIIKFSGGSILISNDGGATWKTAIAGSGINTDELTSGVINTETIYIGNENDFSFRWDSAGLNAYYAVKDGNGRQTYDKGHFVRFDQFGVYGVEDLDSEFLPKSITAIKSRAQFGLTWDGFFLKSKHKINSAEGMVINLFDNGQVEINSEDDIVVTGPDGNTQMVKIGLLDINGRPSDQVYNTELQILTDNSEYHYGIKINNKDGYPLFEVNSSGFANLAGWNVTPCGLWSTYFIEPNSDEKKVLFKDGLCCITMLGSVDSETDYALYLGYKKALKFGDEVMNEQPDHFDPNTGLPLVDADVNSINDEDSYYQPYFFVSPNGTMYCHGWWITDTGLIGPGASDIAIIQYKIPDQENNTMIERNKPIKIPNYVGLGIRDWAFYTGTGRNMINNDDFLNSSLSIGYDGSIYAVYNRNPLNLQNFISELESCESSDINFETPPPYELLIGTEDITTGNEIGIGIGRALYAPTPVQVGNDKLVASGYSIALQPLGPPQGSGRDRMFGCATVVSDYFIARKGVIIVNNAAKVIPDNLADDAAINEDTLASVSTDNSLVVGNGFNLGNWVVAAEGKENGALVFDTTKTSDGHISGLGASYTNDNDNSQVHLIIWAGAERQTQNINNGNFKDPTFYVNSLGQLYVSEVISPTTFSDQLTLGTKPQNYTYGDLESNTGLNIWKNGVFHQGLQVYNIYSNTSANNSFFVAGKSQLGGAPKMISETINGVTTSHRDTSNGGLEIKNSFITNKVYENTTYGTPASYALKIYADATARSISNTPVERKYVIAVLPANAMEPTQSEDPYFYITPTGDVDNTIPEMYFNGRVHVTKEATFDGNIVVKDSGNNAVITLDTAGEATIGNDVTITGDVKIKDGSNNTVITLNATNGNITINGTLTSNNNSSSSDLRKKNTISTIKEKYSLLFDKLNPVTYKFNADTEGKTHSGFIAQEVEKALEEVGLTDSDFGGLVKPYSKNNNTNEYFLQYNDFIALNTNEIQKLKQRVAILEEQLYEFLKKMT